MYDQREALAFNGKLPEQQNPTGVTPQLLDLLAIQKVDADKAAAAKQLALAAGQPQPTVATLLKQKAMQSARQEVMQKLGLAGLQQAQPPQGPMPQQLEEPQGLPGAPSNLPESYRQGGIIAFADGGGTDDGSVDEGPQFTPEQQARIDKNWAAMERFRDQDPEEKARQAQSEYQSSVGTDRLAAIQAKRDREKGLQALFERQVSERPSNFTRGLELMGRNLHGVGGLGAAMAGVSEGVNATNAGYTVQDIANYKVLSDLDDQIQAAIDANNVGAYNALTARRKEIEAQMKTGLESGTQMVDVLERTLAGKQRNYATNKQSADNAALRAQTLREGIAARAADAAKAAADRNARSAELLADRKARSAEVAEVNLQKLALQQATAAAKTALANPLIAAQYPEGTTPEELATQTYHTYYDMLKGRAGAGGDGGDVAIKAAAELARRRAGLKTQGGAR